MYWRDRSSDDAQLWAAYDAGLPVAAIVTQIQVNARSAARSGWSAAPRLREWAGDFIAKLEHWARSLGCATLRGVGRPGWARIVKAWWGERRTPSWMASSRLGKETA